MRKIGNFRHPGGRWWRQLGMVGCDHIPFYLILGAVAYRKFNILLTGTVGTSKTTFWENVARALGRNYKVFECDKLSHDYLQGDLNSDYLFRVPKAIDDFARTLTGVAKTIVEAILGRGGHAPQIAPPAQVPEMRLFKRGVDDFPGGFIIFDEVKRGDPQQQALILNILSHRTFDGRPVDSYIVCCTNTRYQELHDFSQALVSRMNLIVQFPAYSTMASADRNMISAATSMRGDEVPVQPEFIQLFEKLERALRIDDDSQADHELLAAVRKFVDYLTPPLIQVFPNAEDEISTRYVKNAIRVFYVYFKTVEIMDGRPFSDMNREELRNAFFSIFPYTMYLEELDEAKLNQVHNACFLAFANAFDRTKITIHDMVKMLPEQSALFLIWDKFISEMKETVGREGERDIVGALAFLDRVKEYASGVPPLQYMLFKRLAYDMNRFNVKLEKDIVAGFTEKLADLQAKVDKVLSNTDKVLEISSEKVDAEFVEKIILASSERIVAGLTYDRRLYETLMTILLALAPDALSNDPAFVQRMYDDLVHVHQLPQ